MADEVAKLYEDMRRLGYTPTIRRRQTPLHILAACQEANSRRLSKVTMKWARLQYTLVTNDAIKLVHATLQAALVRQVALSFELRAK